MRPTYRPSLAVYLVMIFSLCILFALVCCPACDAANTAILTGVKFNNARPYGMVGIIKPVSSRFYTAAVTDLGGNDAAIQTYLNFLAYRYRRLSFVINFGSNLELLTEDPDFENHTLYLSSITGFSLVYSPTERLSVHGGIIYVSPAHPPLPFKFFLGISLPLQE